MPLMNWPPSKGPNPYERQITYKPGRVTRQDLPVDWHPAAAEEHEIIEEIRREENGGPAVPFEPPSEGFEPPRPFEPPPAPPVGAWKVWFQVDDVASLTLEQAQALLTGVRVEPDHDDFDNWWNAKFGTLTVDLTYPLALGVRLTIEPMIVTWTGGERPTETRRDMILGYFLWVVAKEYERIYREHEKYGVWGHAMSDLGFERIIVREDGSVELFIGS